MYSIKEKKPSNISFGILFSIIFFILFLYFFKKSFYLIHYFFLFLSLIFLYFVIFNPNKLSYLKNIWMKLGAFLSFIISPILIFSIYLIFFLPIGLVTKIFKRDFLSMKINKDSYWFPKKLKIKNNDNYFKNQF